MAAREHSPDPAVPAPSAPKTAAEQRSAAAERRQAYAAKVGDTRAKNELDALLRDRQGMVERGADKDRIKEYDAQIELRGGDVPKGE